MSETLKEVINRILFEEEACLGQNGKSKINVYGGEGKFPHLHYEIDGVKAVSDWIHQDTFVMKVFMKD